MSVLGAPEALIKEGDFAILYMSYMNISPLKVERGAQLPTAHGVFHLDDLIGKPFGHQVKARTSGGGWAYVLRPTPKLWTVSLSHRTQILYTLDISQIILNLELRPGSVVIESGTGSGSLTTSMARTVAPHGHIHTFEFNKERVVAARQDFANTGVAKVVTVRDRDVCAHGFPLIGGGVDAVFLDLPNPWKAIDSAHANLVDRGVLCSFSPCIEQVQKTCETLSRSGFDGIRTIECLLRTFEVATEIFNVPDFGFSAVNADATEADAATDAGAGSSAAAAATPSESKASAAEESVAVGEKRKGTAAPQVDSSDPSQDATKRSKVSEHTDETGAGSLAGKGESKQADGGGDEEAQQMEEEEEQEEATAVGDKHKHKHNKQHTKHSGAQHRKGPGNRGPSATVTHETVRPYADMYGHTGYLTFAIKSVPFDATPKESTQ